MGLIIACVIALLAPFIAAFYDQPILQGITYFIAASFMINALGTVQKRLLERELNFKKLFVVNTLAVILAGIVGITMAFCGWGVWSLVAKLFLETVFRTLFLWGISPWRPALIFDYDSCEVFVGLWFATRG